MSDRLVSINRGGVPNIALGVTGGIAAYKAVEILRGLQNAGCAVRIAMTKHACEFITPLTFRALSGSHVIVDDYAPDNLDPIAHITFSQTIDLLLVAPATANIIAKFAHGIADDFLSSTYLACTAPVLIAPAMNTRMWEHPSTRRNIAQLIGDGVSVIDPDEGEMACQTIGPGRLADPNDIVAAALNLLALGGRAQDSGDLHNERVLITAGATREEIDPVRFISNRSSGRMGFAIAAAARSRGAAVTVIAGVTTAPPPEDVRMLRVTSTEEMHRAVMKELPAATMFIAAAAVSDYRPVETSTHKIKRDKSPLVITLEANPDILQTAADMASAKGWRNKGLLLIGFAAETEDLVKNGWSKLRKKNVDLMIINDVARKGAGFDTATNIISIISRAAPEVTRFPLMSKLDAAHRILDHAISLRRATSTHVAESELAGN